MPEASYPQENSREHSARNLLPPAVASRETTRNSLCERISSDRVKVPVTVPDPVVKSPQATDISAGSAVARSTVALKVPSSETRRLSDRSMVKAGVLSPDGSVTPLSE